MNVKEAQETVLYGATVTARRYAAGYLEAIEQIKPIIQKLEYITEHCEPPFLGEKWNKEKWTVGQEALRIWKRIREEK